MHIRSRNKITYYLKDKNFKTSTDEYQNKQLLSKKKKKKDDAETQ